MISIRTTTPFEYPVLYVNQTSRKIEGMLARAWQRIYSPYSGYNVTFWGNETIIGTCHKNSCTGALNLVHTGQVDTMIREANMDLFDGQHYNISFGLQPREEYCSFVTHFRKHFQTYASDCLESLAMFSADFWIFWLLLYSTLFSFVYLPCHDSDKPEIARNRFSKWLGMVFRGPRPKHRTVTSDLVTGVLSLCIFQSHTLYLSQFQTDSAVEIQPQSIQSFSDIVQLQIPFGVHRQTGCYKIVENMNNERVTRLMRPYVSSKAYYSSQRRSSMFTLFANQAYVDFHSRIFCKTRDESRYYVRHTDYPKTLTVFIYNNRINSHTRNGLRKRFQRTSEHGLIDFFAKNLGDAMNRIYFGRKSVGTCSLESSYYTHGFKYTQTILMNYRSLFVIYLSLGFLSTGVFYLEVISTYISNRKAL